MRRKVRKGVATSHTTKKFSSICKSHNIPPLFHLEGETFSRSVNKNYKFVQQSLLNRNETKKSSVKLIEQQKKSKDEEDEKRWKFLNKDKRKKIKKERYKLNNEKSEPDKERSEKEFHPHYYSVEWMSNRLNNSRKFKRMGKMLFYTEKFSLKSDIIPSRKNSRTTKKITTDFTKMEMNVWNNPWYDFLEEYFDFYDEYLHDESHDVYETPLPENPLLMFDVVEIVIDDKNSNDMIDGFDDQTN